MESQPKNPEFRNNPENFHPLAYRTIVNESINNSGGGVGPPLFAIQRRGFQGYLNCVTFPIRFQTIQHYNDNGRSLRNIDQLLYAHVSL